MINTDPAGTKLQMRAISANSSEVAASEFGGETYVLSNTAREAGVVAI